MAKENENVILKKLEVYQPNIIISPDVDNSTVWKTFEKGMNINTCKCQHFDRNGNISSDDLFVANCLCTTENGKKISIIGTYHPSAAKRGKFSAKEWIISVVKSIEWSEMNYKGV